MPFLPPTRQLYCGFFFAKKGLNMKINMKSEAPSLPRVWGRSPINSDKSTPSKGAKYCKLPLVPSSQDAGTKLHGPAPDIACPSRAAWPHRWAPLSGAEWQPGGASRKPHRRQLFAEWTRHPAAFRQPTAWRGVCSRTSPLVLQTAKFYPFGVPCGRLNTDRWSALCGGG